jgi:hypothetical protein
VVVFDKFPSTKVKDLLQIVNPAGGDGVDRAGATVPTQNLPTPSHNSLSGKPRSSWLLQFYLAAHIPIQNFCFTNCQKMLLVSQNLVGDTSVFGFCSVTDLPIARRNSLHRFLEKRKDR